MKKYIVENDKGAIFSCEADCEFVALEKAANYFGDSNEKAYTDYDVEIVDE